MPSDALGQRSARARRRDGSEASKRPAGGWAPPAHVLLRVCRVFCASLSETKRTQRRSSMKVSRPVAVLARASALALAVGFALAPAPAAAAPLDGSPVPPLGTWTGSCGSGFRL